MQLGVSSYDFWNSTPATIIELCNRKVQEKLDDADRQVALTLGSAKLNALAYHNPRKLPKDAPSHKQDEKGDDQSLEEQAKAMQDLRNSFGVESSP